MVQNWQDSIWHCTLYTSNPGIYLAKTLEQHEERNNQGRSTRIRIVETAGRSVKQVLAPNYPWPTVKCNDLECFPCSSSTRPPKISCRVPGIVYRIVCEICDSAGKQAVYHGESGHNAYTRGGEHQKEYKARLSTNCMSIHSRVHHSGEAVFIAKSSANIRMNSGAEWRFNALPRASVLRPHEL